MCICVLLAVQHVFLLHDMHQIVMDTYDVDPVPVQFFPLFFFFFLHPFPYFYRLIFISLT